MAGFESIRYIDPFAPLPIGATEAGVLARVTDPSGLSDLVAYARLLGNQEELGYFGSGSQTAVRVLNTAPLVPGVAYLIEVQFDKEGRDPKNMNWALHKGVISAPVVV